LLLEHITFYILLFVAEVLGTLGGFGSSILLVPIITYYFGFQQALLFTAAIHVVSNLWKVVLFRKGLLKDLLINFGIPSIIAVVVGALLSGFLADYIAEGVLGVFLSGLSLFLLMKPNLVVKPTRTNAAVGGGISGFVAGFLGTGGAIRGLFLSAYDLNVSAFIATSAFIDLGVDASRFVVYLIQKPMIDGALGYIIPVIVLSLAGNIIGKWLVDRVNKKTFRYIVLGLVFIIGIVSIVKFFQGLPQ